VTTDGQRPVGAHKVPGAALAMTVICAAQFVLQLDFSIVNVRAARRFRPPRPSSASAERGNRGDQRPGVEMGRGV
jgi:hypothetical protein